MNKFQLEDTNAYIAETFNERVLEQPPKKKKKRVAPVSVRLSEEERTILEEQAGGLSLSAHIRDRLFGENVKPRKSRGRTPVKDHKSLAMDVSRFDAAPLIAFIATKETNYGTETDGRVSC